MVVLLIRNMDLVNELRNTMEAERLAAEQAAETGAQNQSLSMRLTSARERIAQLQLELAEARSLAQERELRDQALIEEQRRDLATLLSERNDLAEQLAIARITTEQQEQQLADSQMQIQGLQARLDNAIEQRRSIDARLAQAQEQLAIAQREQKDSEQRYQQLSGEYSDLRVKYDKLVRPARSPKGRYVVELRYAKRDGKYQIGFREGTSGDYQYLPETELHQQLRELKGGHDEGLYLKIIIPEDSGLSYTEAWVFTRDMLALYDYYHAEQPN
jgi:chromosome segregation ATPase